MNKKQLKTVIIVCWILLAVCFVIKIFGGNWFELSSDNEKFVQFCTFVDNIMWLKMILACVFQLINGYLVLSIMLNRIKPTKKDLLIFVPLLIGRSLISWYIEWATMIFEAITLIVIPSIINRKPIKNIIICVIVFVLQFLSLVIRNLGIGNFNENNFLFQFMFQFDYYIMLALLYLYNYKFLIKKGE